MKYEILRYFNIRILCDNYCSKYIIKIKNLQNDCIDNTLYFKLIILYFSQQKNLGKDN